MSEQRNVMSDILAGMETEKHKKQSDEAFFAPENDAENEARKIASEAVTHVLLWLSGGRSLADAGLRVMVLLREVRPDLLHQSTLEDIGISCGVTKQYIHKLTNDFRREFGFKSKKSNYL